MPIKPDGLTAAAQHEEALHPVNPKGRPITAWDRRRKTLEATVAEVNKLREEFDALEEALRNRPF